MVRDRATGRFLYTERLERRPGETSWEYVRRSVRREAQIRDRFGAETMQVIVGYGSNSVEEFLKEYPEYGTEDPADGEADGEADGDQRERGEG